MQEVDNRAKRAKGRETLCAESSAIDIEEVQAGCRLSCERKLHRWTRGQSEAFQDRRTYAVNAAEA